MNNNGMGWEKCYANYAHKECNIRRTNRGARGGEEEAAFSKEQHIPMASLALLTIIVLAVSSS